MLTFTYESASRLTDLFFEAINSGLLEHNQKAQLKKHGSAEVSDFDDDENVEDEEEASVDDE